MITAKELALDLNARALHKPKDYVRNMAEESGVERTDVHAGRRVLGDVVNMVEG